MRSAAEAVPRAGEDPLDGAVLAVLDDDPTGSQTVAGVPLLLRVEQSDVEWALGTGSDVVFALTNSRALVEREAVALTRRATRALAIAAQAADRELALLSRSDSTLRGHFPAEVGAIADEMDALGHPPYDGIVLCPAYPEAGRVTIGGIHSVQRDGQLVPVAETEFARDPVFQYEHSDLRAWAAWRAGVDVQSICHVTLDDLRSGGAARVAQLLAAPALGGQPRIIVLDAATPGDLDVAVAGIVAAERSGRRFIYRTGPSFVAARAGRAPSEPLARRGRGAPPAAGPGGLVVIGSHTELTTRQLAAAVERHRLRIVELDVRAIVEPRRRGAECRRAAAALVAALGRHDVALVTSREVMTAADPDESAALKAAIASALVEVTRAAVQARAPRWVVAKGGITSHDVAASALGANRATVLGQLFPGKVSVWRLEDGPRAGLPYVVFPGNVGDVAALGDTLERLQDEDW